MRGEWACSRRERGDSVAEERSMMEDRGRGRECEGAKELACQRRVHGQEAERG